MTIWEDILKTAIHAPSPHNVQPWRIKIVSDTEAELYIDSTRTLPEEDVTGSFIILTMGLFIESLRICSWIHSLDIEYDLVHPPDQYADALLTSKKGSLIHFADLRIISGRSKNSIFDKSLFFKRRTSRLSLTDQTIPANTAIKLRDLAHEWNQKFQITTDNDQIERIMNWNTIALFEDMNSTGYHDEIVDWFRYSDKESEKKLDGLDARCMNTSPVNLWLLAKFPKILQIPILRQIMASIYRRQSGTIPTLGIFSGGFWKPKDAIDAGRFLIHFWLELAAMDIYIHPYGNLVTNSKAADKVQREFGISDIWLIFKIGYSSEPPKSHRLPVKSILI